MMSIAIAIEVAKSETRDGALPGESNDRRPLRLRRKRNAIDSHDALHRQVGRRGRLAHPAARDVYDTIASSYFFEEIFPAAFAE